jgi:DNA polymerase-3 subunit delta
MAKGFIDTDSLCREIVKDARSGVFKPVYLLMGDEPYYVDMVCDAILENCLDESERDFNQTVWLKSLSLSSRQCYRMASHTIST